MFEYIVDQYGVSKNDQIFENYQLEDEDPDASEGFYAIYTFTEKLL